MGQEDYEFSYLQQIGGSMRGGPAGHDLEQYYDCKISPSTPTMVSNFVLPNSQINRNGPYLEVEKQPQSKFRFRYRSEMGGTHGQLKAECPERNKSDYPTVKLCNWTRGPALVQLQLYTAEPNANDRKKHVHELNGKNVNKAGLTGGCELVVDECNNYTATFPNLAIIHSARRDVSNIIYQRKRQEKINTASRNSNVKHNISPTEICKLKEEANEEARSMDLNKVVLRFQAFFFDDTVKEYVPITDYVDSEVIFNLKNAQTGELKMVRMSAVSAPCTGGTEVWMLVEKVRRNNVRVKFFECDHSGQEVWKAYGEFKESDVHHQYAIVFRTPAYRSTNIREPVQVKVQLERPSDGDTSDAIDFQFTPDVLKRSNPYDDHFQGSEGNPYKRQRNVTEPVNLKTNGNPLFLGSIEREASSQSPSQMVPSPVGIIPSPSNQEFYSPRHPSPQSVSHGFNDELHFNPTPEGVANGFTHPFDQAENVRQVFNNSHLFPHNIEGLNIQNYPIKNHSSKDVSPPNGTTSFGQLLSPEAPSPPYNYKQEVPAFSPGYIQRSPSGQQYSANSPYSQDTVPSPYGSNQSGMGGYRSGQASSPIYNLNQDMNSQDTMFENLTNMSGLSDTGPEQIKQCDAIIEQVINRHNNHNNVLTANDDFSNLLSDPCPATQVGNCDLFEFMTNNENMFVAPHSYNADIQADSYPSRKSDRKSPGSLIKSADDFKNLKVDVTADNTPTGSIVRDNNTLPISDLIKSPKIESMKADEQGAAEKTDLFRSEANADQESLLANDDVNALANKIAKIDLRQSSKFVYPKVEASTKESRSKIAEGSTKQTEVDAKESIGKLEDEKSEAKTVGTVDKPLKDTKDGVKILPNGPLHTTLNVAVCVADSLQDYTVTGDIGPLLATHKYLLGSQDADGNNSLHCAVASGNYEVFRKVLKAAKKVSDVDILNTRNFFGETPLHMAIASQSMSMVRDLAETTGCNITLRDTAGNNPIHLAARLSDSVYLEIVLREGKKHVAESLSFASVVNEYNYSGETPLHRAVLSSNVENVQLLLASGADVHLCERKRGANPLHLAAMSSLTSTAQHLIDATDIAVDARMFDGNTALHIAAQSKNVELCSILMKAKANPYATNELCKNKTELHEVSAFHSPVEVMINGAKEDSEEDEEDSDGEDCSNQFYTPFDYADGDKEILSILRDEAPDMHKEVETSNANKEITV